MESGAMTLEPIDLSGRSFGADRDKCIELLLLGMAISWRFTALLGGHAFDRQFTCDWISAEGVAHVAVPVNQNGTYRTIVRPLDEA